MMDWSLYLQSLAGGAMIGVAATVFLLLDGRVAGISGILGGLVGPPSGYTATNVMFVVGLLAGPVAFGAAVGHAPAVHIESPWFLLVAAGLLVGFGSRLGSGCTSGHGVCGLARMSPRSMAAVATFMATAMVTVFILRHVLGGGA
jgi:uncharacterized membrane protein YedE/YeeE